VLLAQRMLARGMSTPWMAGALRSIWWRTRMAVSMRRYVDHHKQCCQAPAPAAMLSTLTSHRYSAMVRV